MTRVSLAILYLFGLLWAVFALAGVIVPRLGLPALDGVERLVGIGLDWVGTQTLAGFGFALAALTCVLGGRTGWALLGLAAIPVVIALSATSLDPRLAVSLPEEAREPYNTLRAQLPLIRLGGVLGLLLIGIGGMLCRPRRIADRVLSAAIPPAVLIAWAMTGWMAEAPALALLAFPGLILLAMLSLQLAEGERPGGAHAFLALLVLLGGLGFLSTEGHRIDLAAAYLALPLLVVAGWRREPRLSAPLLWGHACLIAALVAWLAPGVSELIPRPPPSDLAEIRAALANAESARLSAGGALVAATLFGLIAMRRRRTAAPARRPVAEGAAA